MPMLTLREDALLRRRDEDLGDGVQAEHHQGVERGEGVAEVHEGGDEDEDAEDEGANIAERH